MPDRRASAGRSSRSGPIRWNSTPRARGRAQPVAGDVLAGAAAADIVVLQRHAAKGEHQRALSRDSSVPADVVAGDRALRADDMRQDHRRRARAVAVDRADIAAGEVQKAVDLALRVVKAPGAGPAVGPAEDRARAVFGQTRRNSAATRSSASSQEPATNFSSTLRVDRFAAPVQPACGSSAADPRPVATAAAKFATSATGAGLSS